jgi:acyl-[acyl-carrier-protein] desaturase
MRRSRVRQIAMAGIYDLRIHRDEVLAPILRSWLFGIGPGCPGRGSRRASSSAATSRSWIGKRAGSRRDAPRVRLARKQHG